MGISYETIDKGRCALRMEGDMTIYTAAQLKISLLEALNKCHEVEVDLSEVTDMDSAGLQLLILAKREAARDRKSVRLVAHSAASLNVIDTYDMVGYFGDPVVISAPRG